MRPLLAVIQEQNRIEDKLYEIIRKKDKLIDEYKASGATVSGRMDYT